MTILNRIEYCFCLRRGNATCRVGNYKEAVTSADRQIRAQHIDCPRSRVGEIDDFAKDGEFFKSAVDHSTADDSQLSQIATIDVGNFDTIGQRDEVPVFYKIASDKPDWDQVRFDLESGCAEGLSLFGFNQEFNRRLRRNDRIGDFNKERGATGADRIEGQRIVGIEHIAITIAVDLIIRIMQDCIPFKEQRQRPCGQILIDRGSDNQ